MHGITTTRMAGFDPFGFLLEVVALLSLKEALHVLPECFPSLFDVVPTCTHRYNPLLTGIFDEVNTFEL
jgi:hypothetical protein